MYTIIFSGQTINISKAISILFFTLSLSAIIVGVPYTAQAQNGGNSPMLEATVEESGSPGGTARIEYTITETSGQSSIAFRISQVPSGMSVNETASSYSDASVVRNGTDAVYIQSGETDAMYTPMIVLDITTSASLDTAAPVTAEVLNEKSTVTDTAMVNLGSTQSQSESTSTQTQSQSESTSTQTQSQSESTSTQTQSQSESTSTQTQSEQATPVGTPGFGLFSAVIGLSIGVAVWWRSQSDK